MQSQYNKNGQLIKRIHHGASGNMDFEDFWQYDAIGNVIAYIKKNGEVINKDISWRSECTYDDNGNWIKMNAYNPEGTLKWSTERKIEY